MGDLWHAFWAWFFFSDTSMTPSALIGYGALIVWISRKGRSDA